MSEPTPEETIEWVRQYHYEASEEGVDDFCFNCETKWPCVPERLVREIERLRKHPTGGTMSNGDKDPLGTIRQHIKTAADRAPKALELMDVVIAEGRDPSEDFGLLTALDSLQLNVKEAERLIQIYRP